MSDTAVVEPSPDECPSDDALTAYVEEGPSPASAAIDRHLDCCRACRGAVARLASLAQESAGFEATLRAESPGDPAEAPASFARAPRDGGDPRAPIAPGMRVGRYVVREAVGSGAMGTVYA